jgi:hypothetical protein
MVAKKLQPAQFSDFQAATQAAQMTGLLQALDAGPSARDGFKPGAAFVDFMKSKEVSGKVDQLVNAYGQSGFGAHLVSSTAGGGYREGWNAYGAGLEATYSQLNSANLRRSIAQQRAAFSDPYKRMNVVLGAAGLTPDERTVLGRGIREAVGVPNVSQAELMGTRNPAMIKALSSGSFDKLSYVVQNHKFDDPQMERIRRKAAARWDEMNSVVGLISDSME